MPTGTVKFFDETKGFGFITNEAGGADAFVHITADLENDARGKSSAANLKAV